MTQAPQPLLATRQGSCTPGCGACCEWLVLQVAPSYAEADVRGWVELHGIRIETRDGGVFARIPLACSALTGDKRCALHGTAQRPRLCAAFPLLPRHLAGLESICSYTFDSPAAAGARKKEPEHGRTHSSE